MKDFVTNPRELVEQQFHKNCHKNPQEHVYYLKYPFTNSVLNQ